jgi:xanthine dehydrogenase accessory factor
MRSACEVTRSTRQTTTLSGEGFDALVEAIVPPPHLFVFGTGHDAVPLVDSVLRLGWSVTVWEPSARMESRARFHAVGSALSGSAGEACTGGARSEIGSRDTALVAGDLEPVRRSIESCDRALAIVMGHNVDQDRRALAMLLGSHVEYIGVLGPRHRTATLASVGELRDPRVHAPVGLDLGAETPEEIALSMTAEMLAHVRRRDGGSLRMRETIHHDDELAW